ncbi:MAG: DUF3825 domain-containing protein [Bacteroidetes bacterium]|jgi:hypothetical protein|nr:DUF3825 domain-containing protein [Bacteroidota bacterium]
MNLYDFAFFRGPEGKPDFNHYLRILANQAQFEKWDFPNRPRDQYEILNNFIKFSFLKLMEDQEYYLYQGRAVNYKGEENDFCVFNTGLLDRNTGEELMFFFERNTNPIARSPWFCIGTGTYSMPRFREIAAQAFNNEVPPMADFVDGDYPSLVMDPYLPVSFNLAHFNEYPERLPDVLQELPPETRSILLQGAISLAIKHLHRNYRYAVPMYYMEESRLQLLLPLMISPRSRIGYALILDRLRSEDGYTARTILTFEQAYINARLIAKPEGWLAI